MKKKKLAVLEPEQAYAEVLLNFLQDKKEPLFEISVFTRESAFEDYLKTEKVTVLLISESCEYEKYKDQVEVVMLLSAGTVLREGEEYPSVYKFQSAEQIFRKVNEVYVKTCKDTGSTYFPRTGKYCKQIGIFSPYGGTGKTTLSVVLGNFLGAKQRVLVVNLEQFQKNYSWMPQGATQGVSEFLYYVQQEGGHAEEKLASLVCTLGNLEYLPGVSNYLDLEQLAEEEMQEFVYRLMAASQAEVIIYDISFLGKGLWKILEQCDRIYEPMWDIHPKEDWIFAFSKEEQNLLKKKRKRLCLPWQEQMEGSLSYLESGKMGAFVKDLWKGEVQYGRAKKAVTGYGAGAGVYGRKSVG